MRWPHCQLSTVNCQMTHELRNEKTHVVWHAHSVAREAREGLNGHAGCVVWFTGLSGSGKSTIANLVDQQLFAAGIHSFLLDGDNVRHGLNASPELLAAYGESFARRFGLTFSPEDRTENIRRVGAVADLFASAGIVTLTAFVSPYRADRAAVRERVNGSREGSFVEVFVDTPLAVCEARDPKGLYQRARAGEVANFTGIKDAYEAPENPELRLDSAGIAPEVLAEQVLACLRSRGLIPQVHGSSR
jgi:adenylylsulfate kinase